MSQKQFSSDKDISRYYPEGIQGIATGCSRLIAQGGFLPDYRCSLMQNMFHGIIPAFKCLVISFTVLSCPVFSSCGLNSNTAYTVCKDHL